MMKTRAMMNRHIRRNATRRHPKWIMKLMWPLCSTTSSRTKSKWWTIYHCGARLSAHCSIWSMKFDRNQIRRVHCAACWMLWAIMPTNWQPPNKRLLQEKNHSLRFPLRCCWKSSHIWTTYRWRRYHRCAKNGIRLSARIRHRRCGSGTREEDFHCFDKSLGPTIGSR